MTITNGKAIQSGGAIFNSGTLTIVDSAIENNQAVGIDGDDGISGRDAVGFSGIQREGGDGGRGRDGFDKARGGAIYNDGTITITNTSIGNNQVKGGSGGRGGSGGQGQRFYLGSPVNYVGGRGGDGGNGGNGGEALGGGIFNSGQATLNNVVVGNHSITAGSGGVAGYAGSGGENYSGGFTNHGRPGNAGRSGLAFGEFIYNSGAILSNQALNGIFNGGSVEVGDNWPVNLAVSSSSVTEDGTINLVYTFSRKGGLSTPLRRPWKTQAICAKIPV